MGKLKNPLMRKTALSFERLTYRSSDLVVACSVGMEEGVKSVNPTVSTLVIPNSSDVDLFSKQEEWPKLPAGFRTDLPVLLYAGSLGEMDDCGQILKGLAMVNGGFQMVFVGDGAERIHLEALCGDLGLLGNVYFLGLVPKTEVVKWFAIARLSFVTFRNLPVLHTSSPNKLFDSFAAGVPVIQTTKGWIADLVVKENCGINADPESPQSLAEAVNELIAHPEKAKEMGKEAFRLAKGPFSREKLAQAYREALEKLL
jgi:glycosyltransferase involved in cell wall biosynthesis